MDIVISIASLVGFVLLTALTGLFVAVEFSLTGLERSTVNNHVERVGDRRAKAVREGVTHLSFLLSGSQLGITVTTLATGYLAEPVLAGYFEPLIDLVGLSASASQPVALILALIVATVLSMIFGELVPKNIAITMPLATARFVVMPMQAFTKACAWFIRSMNRTSNWAVRRFGIEPADELASARSPQELGSLVRNSAGEGSIEPDLAEMLEASLEFGDVTAEAIMTPRATTDVLEGDQTVADLVALARETGHSRFPVVDGDLDNTLGVVHIKDALGVAEKDRATTRLAPLARAIPTVPASLDGDAVLKAVRSAGSQLILVADEYGGTAGIVTIEDVVEEILGEVYDEHDDRAAEQDFERFGKSWRVAGLARLDDLAEETGYRAPDGPYETAGGLVMAALGRIPAVGDVAVLPPAESGGFSGGEPADEGRWLARVDVMDERRVDSLILTPVTTAEAQEYL